MSDYSSNFPTQSPTFAFDAKAGKLDSRISYARSSTGTAFSAERHLSSENLISQSADLGSWSEGSTAFTTITSNATAAPDGTTTAAQITGLTGTNKKAIYHGITTASTGSHTGVAYVKPNGHEYVQLMFGGAPSVYQNYHLSGSGTKGNGGNDEATIEKIGDWYKLTISSTALAGWATNYYIVLVDSNTAARYEDSTSTSSIFAWGANFSTTGQKVFNSTSGQIHREYAPLLKTASADSPRFEYASDGQSVGLLIEAQATNLQRYGSDFASWGEVRYTTVTSNSGIAPNGLLEADLAVPNSESQLHYVYDTAAVIASGTTYTGSVYVKKTGHRYIQMTASTANFGNNQWATFDLDDGSIDANNVTASAESVGNGWWRIQTTMTSIAAGTGGMAITFANTATGAIFPTISGNDFSGILLWGWQLETGSSASSLVDTGTGSSQLSRAADSCSLVSAPLLDNGSGGLTVEYDMRNASTTSYALQTSRSSGATNNDGVTIFNEGLFVNGAGSSTRIGSTTSNVFHKVAASWESGSQKISRDGSSVTEDTTTVVPQSGTDKLHIGTRQDGNASVNGHIRNIAIYSEPLTSTNLTTLSQL